MTDTLSPESGSNFEGLFWNRVYEFLDLLLPGDLNKIIIEYAKKIQYNSEPIQVWKPSTPLHLNGIISDNKQLYICDSDKESSSCLRFYTLDGDVIKNKSPLLNQPCDIDIDQNCFYIIDTKHVSIFTLQFQLLSSWPIPPSSEIPLNHLKVDNDDIYVTIYGQHQVLIYKRDGKLKNKIGSTEESSKNGEFNNPSGLTLDKDTLYICDYYNDRVQALSKDKYLYLRQWGSYGKENGQFYCPSSISYCENIIYVGDDCSVQLFTCQGHFLQRIGGNENEGQFNDVYGLCVVKDRLYVSDCGNNRIQVFKRVGSS